MRDVKGTTRRVRAGRIGVVERGSGKRRRAGDGSSACLAKALVLVGRLRLWSERSVALMFDVVVQNGGIGAEVEGLIRADFARLSGGTAEEVEEARMVVVANRRSEAARREYVEDVRARKLTIARGEGVVHGREYRVEEEFGVGMRCVVG